MPPELDPETRLAMFMAASPFYVDLDDPNQQETIADRIDTLPENIKKVLTEEDTAKKIWNLVVVKHGLSADDVRQVARTVRTILIGEEPAANIRTLLLNRLDAAGSTADDIIKVLTQEFIAPNYFQISQLYERKQRQGGQASSTRSPSRPGLSPETGTPKGSTPPKNLIDLRGGQRPSPTTGLPPSPPPMPSGSVDDELQNG